MDPSVKPTVPTTPQLEPVFLINLKLSGGPSIANKGKDKALTLIKVEDGYIETVKNKYGFELDASGITGFDDITTHLSEAYNTLDCKLYGKTPEGTGIYITYQGVAKLDEATNAVMSAKKSSATFEESYVTNNPRVHFDGAVPDKYKWAIRENLVGKGRFVRDPNNNLYVQYYVYVFRSEKL